jgi:glycosyltransferase involved in cell wall biosynthesis
MPPASITGRTCIVIPSFNSGALLESTVLGVLPYSKDIFVVIDGSTDYSEGPVLDLAHREEGLRVLRLNENQGKGAAVLAGLEAAHNVGFTHAILFDADGQHEPSDIPRFVAASEQCPEAMILGVPIFGPDAPLVRVIGRKLGNWCTNLETLWGGIGDSLFGFSLCPIAKSLQVLHGIKGGRRFDFDTQLAVHLYWEGVPPLNLHTRVYYRKAESGGVTHFQYLRDNALLTCVHAGLLMRAVWHLPRLLRLWRRAPLK